MYWDLGFMKVPLHHFVFSKFVSEVFLSLPVDVG